MCRRYKATLNLASAETTWYFNMSTMAEVVVREYSVYNLFRCCGGGQTEPRCSSVALTVRSVSDDQSASYTIIHNLCPVCSLCVSNVLHQTRITLFDRVVYLLFIFTIIKRDVMER